LLCFDRSINVSTHPISKDDWLPILVELPSDIEYELDTLFDGFSSNTTYCNTGGGSRRPSCRRAGYRSNARPRQGAEQLQSLTCDSTETDGLSDLMVIRDQRVSISFCLGLEPFSEASCTITDLQYVSK